MAGASMTFDGVDKVLANLRAMQEKAPQVVAGALREEAVDILAVSKSRVPVDFGILKASATGPVMKVQGGEVSAEIGYGGPAAPYALAVHENPRAGKTGGISPSGRPYRHWAQTGEWKYLERPMLEAQNGFLSRMAERIKRRLG